MQRMLLTSMVCGAAIAAGGGLLGFRTSPLMADNPKDGARSSALGEPDGVPANRSAAAKETTNRPEDQPNPRVVIRKAIPHVVYEDRPVAGMKTQKVAVIRVAYEDKNLPLPTNPEELEKLRGELKALREQRIDALSPEDLVKELDAERAHQREQESWTKLQALRKQLKDLMTEYPETMAARSAIGAVQIIPETDQPIAAAPGMPATFPSSPYVPSNSRGIPPTTAVPFPSEPASGNRLPTY